MEAALTNTLSPKEEILSVCAGKFGQRWKDMAQSLGLKTQSIPVPLGQAVSPEQIEAELEKRPHTKALLLTACETSTGTEQPVKAISQVLKKYPKTLFLVDGITGLGAMELQMEEWGIDVLIGGSQKSFMIPTGLSFISLSKKAWEAYKKSSCSKYYFDLQREKRAQAKGQTAFSSSVSLIRALNTSLCQIEKQGLKSSILRCQTLKAATHVFCRALGLKLFFLPSRKRCDCGGKPPTFISSRDHRQPLQKSQYCDSGRARGFKRQAFSNRTSRAYKGSRSTPSLKGFCSGDL